MSDLRGVEKAVVLTLIFLNNHGGVVWALIFSALAALWIGIAGL